MATVFKSAEPIKILSHPASRRQGFFYSTFMIKQKSGIEDISNLILFTQMIVFVSILLKRLKKIPRIGFKRKKLILRKIN